MAGHHYHHQNGLKQAQIAVVMVPLPAQGHLNQLLQLSRLISSYDIPVHYVGTTTHNRQAKLRVHDVTSIPNAESYKFHTTSAFSIFCYLCETMGKSFPVDTEILKDVPSFESCFSSEFWNFITSQLDCQRFNSGNLFNASKVIEGPYIDILAREQISGGKKQRAIGPFNLVATSNDKNSNQRHKSLEWLDKQAPNSVIFVSFGTITSLTDDQIKELATGLEQSEQKFIWVLRDADKGDVFAGEVRRAELPKGFEERVERKGMVVRDWAPQLEILGHPSTGGFMSHCGWNSCMESITMGVPVAAWPMHSDQPQNCVLITKVLRVGVVVRDWARRDELVTSLTVGKSVGRLMASKEGDEIRKRVAELGAAVRQSVAEGGVSRMELDSFIAHITR
ncbi:hypothetical protein F0562_017436 [Nyssa sinensis]|uniref:Glycosyltransferase N-terminal domain-containing protein n=1 Tax=Nyssa sinensis TaxID=561372 RepID=A0A5J4ZEU5_9ASTE|nr:hypothetical protein F0562_017436 [Nyssa sinensis]